MGTRGPAFNAQPPYTSLAHRTRTPYNTSTPYPPPTQQQQNTPYPPQQQQNTGYNPQPSQFSAPPPPAPSAQHPPNPREAREARATLEREGPIAYDSLTDDQRDEVDQAFDLFDLDKDKRIDYHELKVAFKALGFDVPKSEILSTLQVHGSPSTPPNQNASSGQGGEQSGYRHTKQLLALQQFQWLVAQRILARDPREEILRAFELFDEGQKGKIGLQDLERVARELGEGLQQEELVAMIEEFDLDGDGYISREEFLGICLG